MGERIQLFDDLNPDVDAVERVRFSVRTKSVQRDCELDLGAENVRAFEADMMRWIKPARRPTKPARGVVRQPAARPTTPAAAPAPDQVESDGSREWSTPPGTPYGQRPEWKAMRKDGRDWALENGWPQLGAYGRVPKEVYLAWKAAMGWTGPLFKEWSAWRDREAGSPPVPPAATSKRQR